MRESIGNAELDGILPEEIEEEVRQVAEISMGTEISSEDMTNIAHLCNQVNNGSST